MQMINARHHTRDFWQESYTICVDKLMRAEAAHRKQRRRVRKHMRIAREALWDTDDALTALGAIQA
jgi:hypothetical protein